MKKLLIVLCIMLILCGCKSNLPTTEKAAKTAHNIGVSAALVCNIIKIDSTTSSIIVDIVTEFKEYSDEYSISALSDVCASIAKNKLDALRHDGKLTEIQEDLINSVINNIVNSIDYMVTKRWPNINQYSDLLNVITYNFSDGFLSAYHPINVMTASELLEYDVDAYNYLLSIMQH